MADGWSLVADDDDNDDDDHVAHDEDYIHGSGGGVQVLVMIPMMSITIDLLCRMLCARLLVHASA